MPKLSNLVVADMPIKLIMIGDSGTGKTGSLASLAAAGYNVRIADFDKGVQVLVNLCGSKDSPYVKQNPQVLENIYYKSFSDPRKRQPDNRLVAQSAKAWPDFVKFLMEGDKADEIPPITEWTTKDVLVIDSLTMLSDAAMNFGQSLNGALGAVRTSMDARRDIGAAQSLIRDLLNLITADTIKCHIVVISHITVVTESGGAPKPDEISPAAGYPAAVGRALSPMIPRWFNTMLVTRASGNGTNVKRKLYTTPQNVSGQVVYAKNIKPFGIAPEYPLETGLADYFKAVLGG